MPYVRLDTNNDDTNNDDIFPWDKVLKGPCVCHAAINAIASRTIPDLTDCTMYITRHPDEDCARAIAKSGIKEVKCMTRRKTDYEERARAILLLHGRVSIKILDLKTEVQCEITRDDKNIPLTLSDRMSKAEDKAKERANFNLRLIWDEFFMGLAMLQCFYCNDNDRKPGQRTGACIVNDFKQVLAIGGSSTENPDILGFSHFRLDDGASRQGKDSYAQHAEYNAIVSYNGKETLRDCTLYVTTAPCNVCAKQIAQTRIKQVYTVNCKNIHSKAKEIFNKCNILLSEYTYIALTINEVTPTQSPPLNWMTTRCFYCTEYNKKSIQNGVFCLECRNI